MKRSLRLFVPTLALLLQASTSAQADPVAPPSPTWGYNWSLVSQPNLSGTVLSGISADPTTPGASVGSITFTSTGYQTSDGNSNIGVASLQINSAASPSSPETITNRTYYLRLDLYDLHGGGPPNPSNFEYSHAALFFVGVLNGSFSQLSSSITNTFLGGIDPFTGKLVSRPIGLGLSQSKYADNYAYDVQLTSFVPPGPPGSNMAGSIGAHVTEAPNIGQIAPAPEPSTMLLSCLGLPFLGLSARRQRRNAAQARA